MHTEYEEILVMKQILSSAKTLDEFTDQLRMDMAKTYVQLRQMGVGSILFAGFFPFSLSLSLYICKFF